MGGGDRGVAPGRTGKRSEEDGGSFESILSGAASSLGWCWAVRRDLCL